jgi:hypothetical protein
LIPFLRSSVWITTGFGAKYAGPGGTNFECKFPFNRIFLIDLTSPKDSEEQIENFKKDPASLATYSRNIEGELNKRFTLVSALLKLGKVLTNSG